jgi:hypothetical protein
MSAKVIFQAIEHRQNARGQEDAFTKFEVISHEGSIAGEISMPSANTATVMLEAKRRLYDLLHDALIDLQGNPIAGG